MNKETIEKRIQQLKAEQQQFVANVHGCEGAIQDCNFWLNELNKPEEKEVAEE